jgi:ferredoxin
MAHLVTQPCFGCKYTDCVLVCPVDAFREGEQMLFIDPEACIDCGLCVPECPVEAIFLDDDVPEEWREFVALNAEMSPLCPPITQRKPPLARSSRER